MCFYEYNTINKLLIVNKRLYLIYQINMPCYLKLNALPEDENMW